MFKHVCVYCNEPFESKDKVDYYCCEDCEYDDNYDEYYEGEEE
jgi:hypothetical protein